MFAHVQNTCQKALFVVQEEHNVFLLHQKRRGGQYFLCIRGLPLMTW